MALKKRGRYKGCLLGMLLSIVILFVGIHMIFKVDDADIKYGTHELTRIFKEIGLPPEKVTTRGVYETEGGGITFNVYFSQEIIENNTLLKHSKARKNNYLAIYVLTVDDINYYSVQKHLLNQAVIEFLRDKMLAYNTTQRKKETNIRFSEFKATEYWNKIEQANKRKEKYDEGVKIFWYPTSKEALEKNISFYNETLPMLIVKDNSNNNRIDDVQLKPEMAENLQELIEKTLTSIVVDKE